MAPLAGISVVDLSIGLAGSYCTKLLADAGADVVVERVSLEPRPIERRQPLFHYLHDAKRFVDAADLDAATVVIEDTGRGEAIHASRPDLVVVSLSAFGATGPWAGRAATELTLQAWAGSIGGRGEPSRYPVAAGGELTDWAAGAAAAVAALLAVRAGRGELIDIAGIEVAVTIFNGFQAVARQLTGVGDTTPARIVEVPSVEPASDGWVGVCTLSAAQFGAFAELIGEPAWAEDPEIKRIDGRLARADDVRPRVAAWTGKHTVQEILTAAASRRIPAAPVGNGRSAPAIDHLRERRVFVRNPAGVIQPRPPFHVTGHGGTAPAPPRRLPLVGLRVFDLTTFWAGPMASQVLAAFGADVIKIESVQRPDGTRMATSYGISEAPTWERAPLFHAVNRGKRAVTLDLARPEGKAVAKRLLATCDILIENYVPRVAEQFGLLDDLADDMIVVRMPAWGLSGPWRDQPGFAQTMEQASGLAWLTGYPDGPPICPRGPCDPIGGLHAVFALLAALRERDLTGRGQVVEVPLVEAALAVAAEQFVEFSATGTLLERLGNRSRSAAPQGVYPCAGVERWVAISVPDDATWERLVGVLGGGADPELATLAGRFRHHDRLDELLAAWCGERTVEHVVDALWSQDIPVGAVVTPRQVIDNPHLAARQFFEPVVHPVVGRVQLPRFPARFTSRPDTDPRPAPTLGQHNRQILIGEVGLDVAAYAELERSQVIGTVPLQPGS